MGKAVWRILGPGSAAIAGLLAAKVADLIWRKAGQDKVDPRNPEAPMSRAVGYAALTGVLTTAARSYATRRAARYYTESAGHAPQAVAKRES